MYVTRYISAGWSVGDSTRCSTKLLEMVVDLCHVPDDDEQAFSLGYSCIHLVFFEGNYII